MLNGWTIADTYFELATAAALVSPPRYKEASVPALRENTMERMKVRIKMKRMRNRSRVYGLHSCNELNNAANTVLYSTATKGTALHCTTWHCTVQYCLTLHCVALRCAVLHLTKLCDTAWHCTVLYCLTLHYCIALHYTATFD